MKIDVGEGTRAIGGVAGEDNQIRGYGGVINTSLIRSDVGSNRAVAVAQQQAAAGSPAGEGRGKVQGLVVPSVPISKGVSARVGGAAASTLKILTLPGQHHGRNGLDRSVIVASGGFQGGTTALSGHAPLHLNHSNNLAPPEENGSPGSATPPADTGGDPCPCCSSPPAPRPSSIDTTAAVSLGEEAAVDVSPPCRCGDKAQAGRTGGAPVAAADAVAVGSVGSDSIGKGYAEQQASLIVATESGGTRGDNVGGAGDGAGVKTSLLTPARPSLLQYMDASQSNSVVSPNQEIVSEGKTAAMMVDVKDSTAFFPGEGVVTRSEEATGPRNGMCRDSWPVFPKPGPPVGPLPGSVQTAGSDPSVSSVRGQQQQQQQDMGIMQADTMDRLAQSLAQAQQLALSVEARQTELLGRPKRRPHPSSKQESAAQSRKVRPKNMPQGGKESKPPKLEALGIKVEPAGTSASAVSDSKNAARGPGTGLASTSASAAEGPSGVPVPKQRLLIKIPRAAVTAATAHAAEVAAAAAAAAAAAKKDDEAVGGDTRASKRGKGKSGVKRARPLAGTRASLPPPPPPAPSTRQELPPGCGPPSPSLSGIFGWDMDEQELETARDGVEHLQTSQASRRLTAQSAASPKELASHVQALRLDYLVQKVRPILTKLMSAGTGPQRGLFNVPVDPLKQGIPDYFKRVPKPMDLGTIKSRLLSMSYTEPEAFAADVRLVFTNAIGFNPESHFVHTWAVQLLNEFDQEYSKQIGKLDEGWAKSLNHSCQLCQGQTCVLCGDKCLKLEPPVIICHHCNKRVVRGGVYHITRDGCRLWCSRCHPGLPPELPTDGDGDELVAEETVESSNGAIGSGAEVVPGTGGAVTTVGTGSSSTVGGATTPGTTSREMSSPTPSLPVAGDGASGATGVSTSGGGNSSSSPTATPSGTNERTSAAVGEVSNANNRGVAASQEVGNEQRGNGAGEAAAVATAVTGSGRTASGAENAGGSRAPATVASRRGPGGVGEGGAVGTVEEVKAPLKRDLLRRKFDEEISEPWVQCDRCNSWVHQVCALFNARANVGEARFVCPLCRLRNVVTDKRKGARSKPEVTVEVSPEEDTSKTRKRPKSIDGNGNLLPPGGTAKTDEAAAEGTDPKSKPVPSPAAVEAPRPAASTAATEAPVSAIVTTSKDQEVGSLANGVTDLNRASGSVRGDTEVAAVAGGAAPMEGVVVGTLNKAATLAPSSAASTSDAEATTVLERSCPSSDSADAAATATVPAADGSRHACHAIAATTAETPVHGDSKVPLVNRGADGIASDVARAGPEEGLSPSAGAQTPTGETKPAAAAAAAGGGALATVSCESGKEATSESVPASTSANKANLDGRDVHPKDTMEMDEDVGAEAAGDASSGSAAADNFDVYAASSLPHTPLSRYIESRVRQRLAKLENDAIAATLSIRLISNVEATCEVHAVLRETFCCKDGLGVGPNRNDVPELLKYRSKALAMFQRVDGVEVCLFSMYVQEYGADAPYFNARRAYISYLDSVEYFRPRKHRTAVYHEILVAYLDWLRRRGFKAAHIWSCPPQRGNNFIFWCHPLHQKTPTRDRLSGWYGNMLKRAVQLGVASKVTTLDKTHFAEVERIGILLKNRRTSAAASAAATLAGVKGPDDLPLRPEIPVIFEGDFWAEEAVRLARAVERKDDGAEDTQSPLELCRHALEELLKHPHGAPFSAPVDPTRDRCPDYLVVIEQPMDLGTVAETLDAMKYHDAGAFVQDVRLIFDNARKYNPPKHPIHVAATKLSKVFDKTVRALESAVNRLPGMHEMGLEHLLLEEPTPPAPSTPTATPTTPGAASASATPGSAATAVAPPRPTAPGKRSIPWAFDAIGPLSALARKTWAAHCARTSRAVGTLPSMSESSPVEVGMPSTIPAGHGLPGGRVANSGTMESTDAPPASSERLSRSGSTAVMSVSEFYGPSGARMLQRRSSTASQASLAESYGDGEVLESASATKENREGQAALSVLVAEGAESERLQDQSTEAIPNIAEGATTGCLVKAEPAVPQSSLEAASSASGSSINTPGQQEARGTRTAAATPITGGVSCVTTVAGAGTTATATVSAESGGVATPVASAASLQNPGQEIPATVVGVAPASALPVATTAGVSDGATQDTGSPPPLTLDAPHPGGGGACLPASATAPTPQDGQPRASGVSPASSLSLPSLVAPDASSTTTAPPRASKKELTPQPHTAENQLNHHRVGLTRAMSVDSAPTPSKRPIARSLSISVGGGDCVSSVGMLRSKSGPDVPGVTASVSNVGGIGNGGLSRSVTGGCGGGATPHSPRLRAKSMDSGGRKGKSKRGKGPGSAVMGKADRIGRMLQSLSRAVTRISKDLLVVSLGQPDKPATPPASRAGSGMTKEEMLAELDAWHASSGIDGVLTPDCHDPDPTISRALVDARHTFLEMCQFRHYQFDTLRRAKHSSAMVLYHLHRPESRSLNPFCSRCHRPVRFVRYHCGVCNYDLCAACDEEVGTKCEDGHLLTPYRVTFSTEDAEKSPAPVNTPATGATSLSPQRPAVGGSPVRERGRRNVHTDCSASASGAVPTATNLEAAAGTTAAGGSGAIAASASVSTTTNTTAVLQGGANHATPKALPADSGSVGDKPGLERPACPLVRDLQDDVTSGSGNVFRGDSGPVSNPGAGITACVLQPGNMPVGQSILPPAGECLASTADAAASTVAPLLTQPQQGGMGDQEQQCLGGSLKTQSGVDGCQVMLPPSTTGPAADTGSREGGAHAPAASSAREIGSGS